MNACNKIIELKDPSRIISKAIALLTHQSTKDDVDRQIQIIYQYLILSKDGFLIKDLDNVMKLFDILIRGKLDDESRFLEVVTKAIFLLHLPPVLSKTSDILEYQFAVQEYFSWLGYLVVWLHQENLQFEVLKATNTLLTVESNRKDCMSLASRRKNACSSILSDLIPIWAKVVHDELYHEMLKVTYVLVTESKDTCISLLQQKVVSIIISRLEPTWRERYPVIKPKFPSHYAEIKNVQIIFNILTKLLSHADSKNMQAPSKFTLWSLQWAFRLYSIKQHTQEDRNNVVAILLLLMEIYPDLLVANLTLAYEIAMIAMSKDIVFHPNWTSDINLTTSHADYSYIALLLMCVSYYPHFISGPTVIEECRVVIGLLKLISHQQAIKWTQLQTCYLIELALNVLYKIVSSSTEEFIEDGGPLTILQLLNRTQKNSQMYNYNILFISIQLLYTLMIKFKGVRESVTYNDGFKTFYNLSKDILAKTYIVKGQQRLLGYSIFLLELISNDAQTCQILPLIVNYLKRVIEPDPKEHVQRPRLIISCLRFIWNKIAPHPGNAQEFVKMNGVYLILDVADLCSLPVQMVALGCLIDLCESAQCIPYLITWKRNGKGIVKLLMGIFRMENRMLQVKSDEYGIIEDPDYPLMGPFQFNEAYCLCRTSHGSATLSDMFISCRPKVYCLLQILNRHQQETVEVVNEVYRTFNENLSLQDQITYILADNYLALKLGEEWKEIHSELKRNKIEPLPSDQHILMTMIQMTQKWGFDLQTLQRELLKKHEIKELKLESALYNDLRNSSLDTAWEALKEIKFIARCSERMFRVTSNFQQSDQINSSLSKIEVEGVRHRMLSMDVSITCLTNQSLFMRDETRSSDVSSIKPTYLSPVGSRHAVGPKCDSPQGEYNLEKFD